MMQTNQSNDRMFQTIIECQLITSECLEEMTYCTCGILYRKYILYGTIQNVHPRSKIWILNSIIWMLWHWCPRWCPLSVSIQRIKHCAKRYEFTSSQPTLRSNTMECEICFESYDNEDRTPLILACKCRKIMCLSCVLLRLKSTARCPYCSIRWSVRNYVTQCRDGTPSNLLEKLVLAFQAKEPEIPLTRSSSVLGSGELRNYYEKFLEDNGRKAEEKSAEQVKRQLVLDDVLNEVFFLP